MAKKAGDDANQVDSANVSPSAFASRTLIRSVRSLFGSWRSAICDLPLPRKSPLAATVAPPTALTERSGDGLTAARGLAIYGADTDWDPLAPRPIGPGMPQIGRASRREWG